MGPEMDKHVAELDASLRAAAMEAEQKALSQQQGGGAGEVHPALAAEFDRIHKDMVAKAMTFQAPEVAPGIAQQPVPFSQVQTLLAQARDQGRRAAELAKPECDRCGGRGHDPHPYALMKVYNAVLCMRCQNEWHEHMLASGKLKLHHVARVRCDAWVSAGSPTEACKAAEESIDLEVEIFHLAKKWVEEGR